jgi:cell division protein FtsB
MALLEDQMTTPELIAAIESAIKLLNDSAEGNNDYIDEACRELYVLRDRITDEGVTP